VVVRTIIKYLQRDARNKLTYKVKKNRSKDTRTSPLLPRNVMHRLLACDGCNIIWERAATCTNTRKLVHDETRTTTECDLDSITTIENQEIALSRRFAHLWERNANCCLPMTSVRRTWSLHVVHKARPKTKYMLYFVLFSERWKQ
jgi:hypothetical protein